MPIMATLAALRSQGIGLDLDDFGVGQASLLSIRRFGVRRIKIDRSFVIGIDRRSNNSAMVGGIVSLGRSMGLEALAEGVETPEEEAALTRAGLQPHAGLRHRQTHAAVTTPSPGSKPAARCRRPRIADVPTSETAALPRR
jgi:predicted signal transduction protein with EAL and GGDEF domain